MVTHAEGTDTGLVNPFRFQGQYHAPETGLHYGRYRYYDPVLGRLMTVPLP